MIRLRHITLAFAALCAVAAFAPAAYALNNDYHDVIRECYDKGTLDGSKYTREALKKARRKLPSDIKEYSDCEDLINAALAAKNRPGGGGGGPTYTPPANPALTTPSGAIASTKQDYDALTQETDPKTRGDSPPQVDIANRKLTPTTGGVINSARHTDANDLPLPLIVSLAALAAMAALATATVLRRRWPETRRAALRIFRR
jgi:hypothetical protein